MNADLLSGLRGRNVLITGGGRGLGYEMALALAAVGANVAVTAARSAAELAQVADEAGALPGGGSFLTLQSDVIDSDQCCETVAAVIRRFGSLDVLINNAGRGLKSVNPDYVENPIPFWKAPTEGWFEIVQTNILGVFNMSRPAAAHMVEKGYGKIINISTSDITMVRRAYSPYGPSKAFLEAASRSWAEDLAGTGVTVNVFLPGGATDTAILPDMASKRGSDGNLLDPKIMRGPVLWLCSNAADNHTGGRYIARLWDDSLPPNAAAAGARDVCHEKPGIM